MKWPVFYRDHGGVPSKGLPLSKAVRTERRERLFQTRSLPGVARVEPGVVHTAAGCWLQVMAGGFAAVGNAWNWILSGFCVKNVPQVWPEVPGGGPGCHQTSCCRVRGRGFWQAPAGHLQRGGPPRNSTRTVHGPVAAAPAARWSPSVPAGRPPDSSGGTLCLFAGMWGAASRVPALLSARTGRTAPYRLSQEVTEQSWCSEGPPLTGPQGGARWVRVVFLCCLATLCLKTSEPHTEVCTYSLLWRSRTVLRWRDVVAFFVKERKLQGNLKLKVSAMLAYFREYSSPSLCFNYSFIATAD